MQHRTHSPAYPWPETHSVTCTPVIPYALQQEMNGGLPSGLSMDPLSGW